MVHFPDVGCSPGTSNPSVKYLVLESNRSDRQEAARVRLQHPVLRDSVQDARRNWLWTRCVCRSPSCVRPANQRDLFAAEPRSTDNTFPWRIYVPFWSATRWGLTQRCAIVASDLISAWSSSSDISNR